MSTYGPVPQRDVVTGEAVALDLRVAQLPSRALALMIDMAIQIVVLIVAFFLVSVVSGSLDDAALAALALVVTLAVIVGYPLVLETLTRGRSVGKLALGLRVVRDDGGPVRFRHALVRALLEFVEIWLLFGVPAVVCSLANSRGKRLGDLAAGTVVIRERVPARVGVQATMPPELAAWAATVDVGRVPETLAHAARQFLVRAPELRPETRWSMSVGLAKDVYPYLAPPPPQQVPPERLLAAVVAERRRREEARLAAQVSATRAWTDAPRVPGPGTAAPPAAGVHGSLPPPAARPAPSGGTPTPPANDGFAAPS